MKKKLSRIAALLLAVVMVITGFTVMPKVEAAEMPTFTVKVSSTEVKPGDKITVEFWLEGGVDVTSFAGFLNIDKNVYSYSGRDVEEGDLYWDLYDKGAMPIFSADESGDGFLVLLGDEVPMSEGGLIATITLTVKEDAGFTRNELSGYLESRKIQTRNLFAGNLIKHPAFDDMRNAGEGYRVVGDLHVTDYVMNNTFWIGVYPGMTDEMLSYMVSSIKEFVSKRKTSDQ